MTAPAEALVLADRADPRASGGRLPAVLLLVAATACAACGLVYELALIALGGYLIGNTIHQTSIVLGVFVFAMGVGALAAKPLSRWPVRTFAVVESALAVVGGMSVIALYAAFAWLGLYQPFVIVFSLLIGALIGAEIPILVSILQRLGPRETPRLVADLFAADYVGALIGGLAFPFVLLPVFGLVRGAIAAGVVNIAAAAVVVAVSGRGEIGRRGRAVAAAVLGVLLLVLVAVAGLTSGFEASARQALYDDPIVHAERTQYQEIVITRSVGRRDLRLFLNGDLQFSSIDEYRYHEALVHPAMNGPRERVLVLGGGDGLAAREVLRYGDVRDVVLVELDPAVVELATRDPLRALNQGSLRDPRLRVVTADAFSWVRDATEGFDVIVADFPDPEDVATAKLYSQEMFGMARRLLRPEGRLVVQAGSPAFAREAFWSIERTVREAGLSAVPYHVDVPSFGDWGFVLAATAPPELRLPDGPPTRSLTADALTAAAVFAPDRSRVDVEPSTLLKPAVLDYQRRGWRDY